MKTNKELEPVEVFSGTIMECEMVKSLLENAEIVCYLNNEFSGTIAPWIISSGGINSVKLIVSNADFENAMIVVNEYKSNVKM
jgi:hypothetical protein